MTFYGEVYLDGRILVNNRNHLGLNYKVKLSELVAALPPSTFAVYTFQNGLTLDVNTLTVSWGGTLVNDTVIDGEGFSVTYDDVNIFSVTNTQVINLSSLTDVNITAVGDVNTNANNIVNVAVLNIDNTAENIYNQASNEITSTSLANLTYADFIEQNANVSIINNTPVLTNNTDQIANNATISIINTTPLFQTDAATIDNNADTITNDATISIISTSPLIQEEADTIIENATISIASTAPLIEEDASEIKETATASITCTTPNMYDYVDALYRNVNAAFYNSCSLSAYYTSGNSIDLFYDYTQVLPIPTAQNGQFSMIQGFNTNGLNNYIVASGLYTFVDDCYPRSVIRTNYKDYNTNNYTATSGSFTAEAASIYLEAEEVGVNQIRGEMTITGNRVLTQYRELVNGNRSATTHTQSGVGIEGDLLGVPYTYLMPTTTPNAGDTIFAGVAGELYFGADEKIVESRNVVISAVIGSKFRFTLPFTSRNMLATRLNWFVVANDGGTVELTISDVQIGSSVVIGTESFNIAPAVPTLTQVGSITLANPALATSTHGIWDIEITNITGTPGIDELSLSLAFVRTL